MFGDIARLYIQYRWRLFLTNSLVRCMRLLRNSLRSGDSGSCANRTWSTVTVAGFEITLTMRNLGDVDGYSREELAEMLRTVRLHERLQGWKVPDVFDN